MTQDKADKKIEERRKKKKKNPEKQKRGKEKKLKEWVATTDGQVTRPARSVEFTAERFDTAGPGSETIRRWTTAGS